MELHAVRPEASASVHPFWTEYTDFLEQGCDAALFVGMHAMAGTTDGVMSHTVSGRDWWRLTFNGQLAGETAINAALCGTWGCPVLLGAGSPTCPALGTGSASWLWAVVSMRSRAGRSPV